MNRNKVVPESPEVVGEVTKVDRQGSFAAVNLQEKYIVNGRMYLY